MPMKRETQLIIVAAVAIAVIAGTLYAMGSEKDSEVSLDGTWYLTKSTMYTSSDGNMVTNGYVMEDKASPLIITSIDDGMFIGTFNGKDIVGGVQGNRISFEYYNASTGYETNCTGALIGSANGKTYNALYLTAIESKNGGDFNVSSGIMFKEGHDIVDIPGDFSFPTTFTGIYNSMTFPDGYVTELDNFNFTVTSRQGTVVVAEGSFGDDSLKAIMEINAVSSDRSISGMGVVDLNGITWICYLTLADGKAYLDYFYAKAPMIIGHALLSTDWSAGSYETIDMVDDVYTLTYSAKNHDGVYVDSQQLTLKKVRNVDNTFVLEGGDDDYWTIHLTKIRTGIMADILFASDDATYVLVGFVDENHNITASGTQLSDSEPLAITIKMVSQGEDKSAVGTWYMTQYERYDTEIDSISSGTAGIGNKLHRLVISGISDDAFYGTITTSSTYKIAGGLTDKRIQFSYFDASTGYSANVSGYLYTVEENGTENEAMILTAIESKTDGSFIITYAIYFKEGTEPISISSSFVLPTTYAGTSSKVTLADGTVQEQALMNMTLVQQESALAVMQTSHDGHTATYALSFSKQSWTQALYASGVGYFDGKFWATNMTLTNGKAYMEFYAINEPDVIYQAEFTTSWTKGSYIEPKELAGNYTVKATATSSDGKDLGTQSFSLTNIRQVGDLTLMMDSEGRYWTVRTLSTYTGIQAEIYIFDDGSFTFLTGYVFTDRSIDAVGSQYSEASGNVAVSLHIEPL